MSGSLHQASDSFSANNQLLSCLCHRCWLPDFRMLPLFLCTTPLRAQLRAHVRHVLLKLRRILLQRIYAPHGLTSLFIPFYYKSNILYTNLASEAYHDVFQHISTHLSSSQLIYTSLSRFAALLFSPYMFLPVYEYLDCPLPCSIDMTIVRAKHCSAHCQLWHHHPPGKPVRFRSRGF